MAEVVIIDYGVGNFRNVQKAFEAVGAAATITAEVAVIKQATALVLPGVGAFGDAMDNLRARQFEKPILQAAEQGKPLLGICVGLQLLFEESDEMGLHTGLGLLPGRVERFPTNLTVPHMGWNQIEPTKEKHPLLNQIMPGDYAYFAHSYHVVTDNPNVIIAQTDYGAKFPSMVGRDNINAIQFHPEKSQRVGLRILKNFVELVEQI